MIPVKNIIFNYLKKNTLLLTVLMLMFAAGIIFGGIGVVFLEQAQVKEISFFVDRVFNEAVSGKSHDILTTVFQNVKLITVIWFLGLTIVGIPLVGAVVFTRGFALGFTAGFLVKFKGLAGIGAILMVLFPPNLFLIPLLLFASTNSIVFSLCLLKSSKKEISLGKNFVAFTLSMLLIAALSSGFGALQALLSPAAIKMVTYIFGR